MDNVHVLYALHIDGAEFHAPLINRAMRLDSRMKLFYWRVLHTSVNYQNSLTSTPQGMEAETLYFVLAQTGKARSCSKNFQNLMKFILHLCQLEAFVLLTGT
jgi:hypothetical protein